MPESPAFLADAFAPRFARPAHVERIGTLSSNIRRIRSSIASAARLRFSPGQEIEFRVGATSFRHETPSTLDPVARRLAVIFFLHGSGPGSAWAAALREHLHAKHRYQACNTRRSLRTKACWADGRRGL